MCEGSFVSGCLRLTNVGALRYVCPGYCRQGQWGFLFHSHWRALYVRARARKEARNVCHVIRMLLHMYMHVLALELPTSNIEGGGMYMQFCPAFSVAPPPKPRTSLCKSTEGCSVSGIYFSLLLSESTLRLTKSVSVGSAMCLPNTWQLARQWHA